MICTSLHTFHLSKAELADSPSRRDGVPKDVEDQLRVYGCELIQEGGILLKLPQAAMATGQVLFQRFYCKKSVAKFDVKRVAWACCWLATKLEDRKLEEMPRRVRDVLSVLYRLDRRREGRSLEPLDIFSKKYRELKAEVIHVERLMLRALGFIMLVDHPHKLVLSFIGTLCADARLMQEAWSLTNDSLRTTLCVRFKSEVVACGLIFMAARRLQIPLPASPPWWDFHNVARDDVFEVCRVMHAMYSRPKAVYVSVF